MKDIDFKKSDGLVPAIIQDADTQKVLMLGYMNEEALRRTLKEQIVTFFSRSKNRLWTKGETSGHYLNVVSVKADCDSDALLIQARPQGPICHTGSDTCFNEENKLPFLTRLEAIIRQRRKENPEDSYTAHLFHRGINKIAQKVGEEAVELIIEAKDTDRERFLGEAADLMFHFLVLLEAKNCALEEVINVLESRH